MLCPVLYLARAAEQNAAGPKYASAICRSYPRFQSA